MEIKKIKGGDPLNSEWIKLKHVCVYKKFVEFRTEPMIMIYDD